MTRARRWTRREYDRLIEHGFLHEDDPVELLGGQLMVAEPQGSAHAVAVSLAARALGRSFGAGWYVMVQLPIALDEESEPEPDVAVAPGEPRDYREGHPSRPALLVEVAESTLASDRRDKGSLYARAGIEDYWIVNLVDRVLEVHRVPAPEPGAPFGHGYERVEILGPEASVAPLALRGSMVSVADLLP